MGLPEVPWVELSQRGPTDRAPDLCVRRGSQARRAKRLERTIPLVLACPCYDGGGVSK